MIKLNSYKYFKNNTEIKKLPNSIEAEQSVIGGLIISNNKIDQVISKINKEDFFIPQHKIIFNEINNLFNQKKPVDLITLSESLERKKILKLIGGFSYLAELSKNTSNVLNIITYCEIIKEKSILRKILNIFNNISKLCYKPNYLKNNELLNLIELKISQISNKLTNNDNNPQKIENILNKTINNIKKLYNNPNNNKIIGIKTGYLELDKKTLGFQKSDLIIIAARPSMGKTTFAINLCEYSLLNDNKPVLIFSLEMSSEQIMTKILSSLTKIDHINIRTGNLTKIEWKKIFDIANILNKKKNIYIDDSSSLTTTEIRSKSKKIFRENNGINLIVIDYLQLIKTPFMYHNRTLEITEISRFLKSLAKELNIPIITISQLNRSLEQRSNKRPINSDLRESGSIEQDADLIMFLYREEIYKENDNKKGGGITEIIISKHRNGPIGLIKLIFNNKFSRFDNLKN
ncbi:replicative DNA helicase [endosymbiont of Euscepes postfasciatus]|uniref:replicative DNA helicase n=1 Tax=endosymbiont of Euscepes postfasciatus TaxID=650377 RepID=UPI000DC6EAD4|nr:replicative DNA helicase [endosymbiont of Euscepes postfasciatus]BBA84564.1 replicative DNA helicase [endosymbiont of Euscepes postfasciatus]